MKEAILEPVLRRMRLARVLPYVKRYPGCALLDVGCGWEARLLKEVEPYIASGVGVDFKAPALDTPKLKTITTVLSDRLPFEDARFDIVTLLAVLEHLDEPEAILREIARVMKPGGLLVLTVPSWRAKPVLEFMSFRLGIVSRAEIEDHKRYYDRRDLDQLFARIPGLTLEKHAYFQLGMNNHCVLRRDPTS